MCKSSQAFHKHFIGNTFCTLYFHSQFIGEALACLRNQNFHENFIGTYLACYYIIGDSWVYAESAKTFMGISLVSYYRIVQFHNLFIGKGFGIENSYINLHDFDVKFIAFRHANEKPIKLKS